MESQYKNLLPTSDAKREEKYREALNYCLKEDDEIKNIAVSGSYGSGKSSLIKTYLKNNADIANKSITLSFLCLEDSMHNQVTQKTLSEKNIGGKSVSLVESKVKNKEKEAVDYEKECIRKEILKQMFYAVNPREIPQSEFVGLYKKNDVWIYLSSAVFAVYALILVLYKLCPSCLEEIPSAAEILFVGIPLLIGVLVLSFFIKRKHIKGVEVKALGTSIAVDGDIKNSFDKNIDEIVYWFECTDYRYVFLEDIDRSEASKELFVELRSINKIINDSPRISEKPIKFIYLLKDNQFKDAEYRTKFFDFILPVIPYISKDNSKDLYIKTFNHTTDSNLKDELFDVIADYIYDARTIYNLRNEFLLYKENISEDMEGMDETELLAVLSIKSFNPTMFAYIEKDGGYIRQLEEQKRSWINKKIEENNKTLKDIEDEIKQDNKEIANNAEDLLYIFIGQVCKKSKCSYIEIYKDNQLIVSAKQYFSLGPDAAKELNYYVSNNYYGGKRVLSQGSIDEEIEDIFKRYNTLNGLTKKNLLERRERIIDENCKVSTLSMSEYIREKGLSENLTESLIERLIREKYIKGDYREYINVFHGASLTIRDRDFVQRVRKGEKISFDESLDNALNVIKELTEDDFKRNSIWNVSILDCLVENEDKYKSRMNSIIERVTESDIFLEKYLLKGKMAPYFSTLMAKRHSWFLEYVLDNSWIENNRKREIVNAIMYALDDSELFVQNQKGVLKAMLENNLEVQRSLTRERAAKIIGVIKRLNLKFEMLHDTLFVDPGVAEEVVKGKRFAINFTNVKKICDLYYHQEFNLGIFDYADTEVRVYLLEQVDIFVKKCLLHREYKEKDHEEKIELLWKYIKELNDDIKMQWLEKEEPCYERIEDLVSRHLKDVDYRDYLHIVFEKKYWRPTWENLEAFYKYDNLEVELERVIPEIISDMPKTKTVPDLSLLDYLMSSKLSDEDKLRVLKNIGDLIGAKKYVSYLEKISAYRKIFESHNKNYHTETFEKGEYDEQIISELIKKRVMYDKKEDNDKVSVKVRNVDTIQDTRIKHLF